MLLFCFQSTASKYQIIGKHSFVTFARTSELCSEKLPEIDNNTEMLNKI